MAEDNSFEEKLNNPEGVSNPVPESEIVNELNDIQENEYLKKIRKKNSKYLVKLDYFERERIARHIKDLYDEVDDSQQLLRDRLDEYDDVYRMKPIALKDDDGETPNYRSGLSTVNLEVIHANIMNVFFTPKDTMRVLPTETNDVPKVKKLDIFGNWSMKNEMMLQENTDRLFHSSGKNGECPYIVHWVKEYGTEIKIEMLMNPANPKEPLIDPDTKEPLYQEREVPKILYNAPKLEIFSRKDYIIPKNAMSGKLFDWDMRVIRMNADKIQRYAREGKYYDGIFDEIGGWGAEYTTDSENATKDTEGNEVPLGKTEKLFIEFYGRLRVNAVKNDEQGEEQYEELEDEFIAVVELKSETLCQLKKNRFPLKMRPIGLDEFIPDDEGRQAGIGVVEFLDGCQTTYDALYNQYLFGTVQANNPFGFFAPTGNTRDEPLKIKAGYLFPTADPQSINIVKIPPPDVSLKLMMDETMNHAQRLLGIGDYSMGLESSIDPSAPARKAELVVAQGNVRLNLIIKRKNRTLKDIFKRWFLLYQANMPPNKFMRIAGEDPDNPYKFEKINMDDFALNSIPDFELTGNILNVNKQLEAQKAVWVYDRLAQNPFYNPGTREGMLALHSLTKWFIDRLDEVGLSSTLPMVKSKQIHTPQEENALFLQGDDIEPAEGEDHVYHSRVHGTFLLDPTVPDEVKQNVVEHIKMTVEMLKKQITEQMVMQNLPQMAGGMQNGNAPGTQGTPQAAGAVLSDGLGMARPEAGVTANLQ